MYQTSTAVPAAAAEAAGDKTRGPDARSARWRKALVDPVDASSLAYFRIFFGLILVWEVWRYFDPAHDWISKYFAEPQVNFTYWPFEFVSPWPGPGMWIHFALLGVAAACMAAGIAYRVSSAALFVLISYVFLLDQARYLNHIYLVCLLALIMVVIPAHRTFSVDARLRPRVRSDTVPAWSLWLLRFQIAVPFVFGGIAKLSADWLAGEPLRAWLSERSDFPLVGSLFTNEAVVWTAVYGSLLLDLVVIPLLLFKRTRLAGFAGLLVFSFMNARLFHIGIFPWLMIVAAALFFDADWPRRLCQDLRGHKPAPVIATALGFASGVGIYVWLMRAVSVPEALLAGCGVAIFAYHVQRSFAGRAARQNKPRRLEGASYAAGALADRPGDVRDSGRAQRVALAGLVAAFVAVQVMMPLRHFVIPGNANWTEEGHNYAWHMKLRDKSSVEASMHVRDPVTGAETVIDPRGYLEDHQVTPALTRPDLLAQLAQYVEADRRGADGRDLEVRMRVVVKLNDREPGLLVDPNVDLTTVGRPVMPGAGWILPVPAR